MEAHPIDLCGQIKFIQQQKVNISSKVDEVSFDETARLTEWSISFSPGREMIHSCDSEMRSLLVIRK